MDLLTTLICKYPKSHGPFVELTRRCISKWQDYKKCYEILGVPEGSDQEQIKSAYLSMVKRYHPDSGTDEANVDKFYEIDRAFKTLTEKNSRERWGVEEEEDSVLEDRDVKHVVPQHRQYLSYGGVGSGTPFQRQKQYQTVRAVQAAENVLQHRMNKVSADDKSLMVKAPLAHKIKTKYGFDRLVEDLIQESMSRGEFNNLSGFGKPLPDRLNNNPFVDSITHKLNEVLIDNGFTPEWITLQKEIREDLNTLREGLATERSYFGRYPLTTEENIEWTNVVCKYETLADQINRKISKYNLVVPILDKQMIPIELRKEAQRVVINGKFSTEAEKISRAKMKSEERDRKIEERKSGGTGNIFGLIETLFKK